jgi:hypothetical protein
MPANVVVEMSGDESKLFRSYQRIIEQAKKLDIKHKEVKTSSDDAFGNHTAGQLSSMVAQYATMASAIGLVVSGLRSVQEETKLLGQGQRTSGPAMGMLAQLVETPAERDRIIAEAKKTFDAGGAKDLTQAIAMQFALESAQAGDMRADFARMQKTGLVPNAQLMAESAKKLQNAFGETKTGDLAKIVSTSFGGGKIGLGSAEELLTGAAEAGVFASRIGLSPEEDIAAVSTMSGTLGPQKAGTAAEQLFKQIETQGIVEKGTIKRGKGLQQYIDQIQALEKKGMPISDIIGNRAEAIVGYGLLTGGEGPKMYKENIANIAQAQRENWMEKKLALASEIPENIGAMAAQRAENRNTLSGTRAGVWENVANAVEEDLVRKERGRYGAWGVLSARTISKADRMFGLNNQGFADRWGSDSSPETQAAIRAAEALDKLSDSATQANDAATLQRARAAANVQPE